jgi:MFS family permease
MNFFTAVYLFFRFVTGFCGSPVLVISGGMLSDMFENKDIAL